MTSARQALGEMGWWGCSVVRKRYNNGKRVRVGGVGLGHHQIRSHQER